MRCCVDDVGDSWLTLWNNFTSAWTASTRDIADEGENLRVEDDWCENVLRRCASVCGAQAGKAGSVRLLVPEEWVGYVQWRDNL